jgi:hypothetical protein
VSEVAKPRAFMGLGLLGLIGALVAAQTPEIKRYLKIRSM